jgi:hypothetical protein
MSKIIYLFLLLKKFLNTFSRCSQHRKEELSLYCLSCSKAICAQCIGQIFEGKVIEN